MARPLCRFYAAAVARLMRLFDLDVAVAVIACRGTGAPACLLAVSPAAAHAQSGPGAFPA